MAYIEPKTDWEPSDYITPADYNRIKNNLVYINDLFNEMYEEYVFEPGEDIGIDEWFRASKFNMFEDCVENFQRSGTVITFGERSYYSDNGHLPNYNQLNRLEKCIEAYADLDIPVTGISISPTSFILEHGHSQTVNITISPANATDKEVSITLPTGLSVSYNSDYSVATITAESNLAGNKYTDLSFVTHDGGFTANLTITIKGPITTFDIADYIKLDDQTISVYDVPVTYVPESARYGRSLSISSVMFSLGSAYGYNDYVRVIMSSSGGNGCFDATTDGITKRCYIFKTSDAIERVYTANGYSMYVNATRQFQYQWGFVKDEDKNVTWSVTNPAVATINQNGLVTATAAGQTKIKVTWLYNNKEFLSDTLTIISN